MTMLEIRCNDAATQVCYTGVSSATATVLSLTSYRDNLATDACGTSYRCNAVPINMSPATTKSSHQHLESVCAQFDSNRREKSVSSEMDGVYTNIYI